MTAFKIGSIYRDGVGRLIRVKHVFNYPGGFYRGATAVMVAAIDADGEYETGVRRLEDGKYHDRSYSKVDLIPGECDEHGNPLEDKKEPETVTTVIEINPMAKWPFKQTATIDKLAADSVSRAGDEPKRAPLPGYGQSTPFDNFKGFTTTRDTSEHHSVPFLCASPDLQDESIARHQLATVRD